MIKLSILDQSHISEGSTPVEALANTIKVAQEAEKLGYHRFWVSEHHFASSLAGSSPEVLISYIAAKTSSIRIGSGGVMLPHYSPYKVAENFRVLEGLSPNRIDLGVGRAPGGMHLATRALQEGKRNSLDNYPQQIDDLIAYLHDQVDEKHRFAGLQATPSIQTAPELWMLGSSGDSAMLAAERGANFAYAQFISGQSGAENVRWYQEKFRPSILGDKPNSLVSIFVVCSETEEEATQLVSSIDLAMLLLEKGVKSGGLPSVETALNYSYSAYDLFRIQENRKKVLVGNPQQVKEQILTLAEKYRTNEIMIVVPIHDFDKKLNTFRLLSQEFNLQTDKETNKESRS